MVGAAQFGGGKTKDQRSESSGVLKAYLVAGSGGLLTAAVVVGMLSASVEAGHAKLSFVPKNEIAAAAATLTSNVRAALVGEAKACTVPLAYVTLVSTSGSPVVRIKSGNYLSPPVTLGQAPRRLAIPFPAPYPTGRGQIGVVGGGAGVLISLYPTWRVNALQGGAVTNVWWTPNKPC